MNTMNKGQTWAVLVQLVDSLQRHGSWCGETHIQKACYFLGEVVSRELPFTHTLYKHGPYSFDLCDTLTEMRANGLLELQFQTPPYGPRYRCTENGSALKGRYPRSVGRFKLPIEEVSLFFGNKGVAELERLSTALYVLKSHPEASDPDLVKKIVSLKPHIQEPLAGSAVTEVKRFLN